jgi:hypothetical protein
MGGQHQDAFSFSNGDLRQIPLAKLQKLKTIEFPPNQSGAYFALEIGTPNQFVVKHRDVHVSDIVAEATGWLLSRALGVLTPDAAVVMSDDGAIGWASKKIEYALGWHPDDADLCSQNNIAGIFVLDAIIGNPDRHKDNVLVVDRSDDQPKEVYSIDLALSWLGYPEEFPGQGLNICEIAPKGYLQGSSRDLVEENASFYIEKCRRIAENGQDLEGIAYIANTWTGLLNSQQQAMLASSLRARLSQADTILEAFLDATLGPKP